jgi:twitching motility protein PilI
MSGSTPEQVADEPLARPDAGARRTRLREFQTQLVKRMEAAKTGSHVQAGLLGVMLGRRRWLIELRDAGEIAVVGSITKVPLTCDWFLGLTNMRGNLISVIDFARFQGLDPSPIEKDSRIISFAPSLSFNAGLLASRVFGLRSVAEMELLESTDTGWSSRRYRDRDAQEWTVLDIALLLQDSRFLHIGS